MSGTIRKFFYFFVILLVVVGISGCTKQEEAQNAAVNFFVKMGAEKRSVSGATQMDDFFAPASTGGHTYTIIRPSNSVYLDYSLKANNAIQAAITAGIITSEVAGDLVPIISDIKMVFDLYEGLDKHGMVQGQFYVDKKAVYSSGVVMVVDAQTITDPEVIKDLAWYWLKKRGLPLMSFTAQEYNVQPQKDFYILNNRWVIIIATTTTESYNDLAQHAPGAKIH